MSDSSGFTLIEAIIVMALIGILSAISVISMAQWLPGYHLKSAAQDLFNNMHYAKSQAITENRAWAVVFDDGSPNQYTVVSSGPDGNISTDADNIESRTVVLSDYGSGVAFGHKTGTKKVDDLATAVTDDADYCHDASGSCPDGLLVFNSNGTADAGYVYLTNNRQHTDAVGTFMSGLIRFKQWDGSAWQ